MKQISWKSHVPLVILLALYVATRLLALRSAGSFWFDEAFSAHFAAMPLRDVWHFLQYEHNPLLHVLLLKVWGSVFGTGDTSLRSLSLVCGFGMSVMLYALGKTLYNKRVGMFALFLSILSTLFLYHQTEARMYALESLLAIVALLSVWHRKPVLYAMFGLLLVHTHLTAWSLIVALALFLLASCLSGDLPRAQVRSWIYAHGVIVLGFLPWFIPVAIRKLQVGNISQGWFFAQTADGYAGLHITNALISGESALFLRVAACALLLFLLARSFVDLEKPDWWQKIRSLFDHDHWPLRAMLTIDAPTRFLLIILGTQTLIGFALQITVTKYLITAALPLFLLAARGYDKLQKRWSKMLVVIALLAIAAPMHIRLYTQQRHHWTDLMSQIGLYHRLYPQAGIIVHTFADTLLLQRYASPATDIAFTPFYPLKDDLSFDDRVVRYNWQGLVNDQNAQLIRPLVDKFERVMLVSSTLGSGEQDPVKKWFWTHGWTLERSVSYNGYGDGELVLFRHPR